MRIKKENRKAFVLLMAFYALAVYSIIRANFNYIDDMGRVAEGYAEWEKSSRYVSDFLAHLIHGGAYLTDISPLPQLLAVCIMALASMVVINSLNRDEKIRIWDLIAVAPLAISPYFMECFSYKYDAPYMALSVLSSVMPVLFREKRTIIYGSITVGAMLVMCMTYQAASGIFPMLIVCIGFQMWYQGEDRKKILNLIIKSAIFYGIGIGIYFVFIMKPIDTYVSTGMASFHDIMLHYKKYLELVLTDFRRVWLLCMALIAAGFVISSVIVSKRNKLATGVLAVATVILMAILSVGLYPALGEPLFEPRAMYGIGAWIALLGVAGVQTSEKNISQIFTVVMAWCFLVFAMTYGNALAVQQEYTGFRTTELIEDLTDLEVFQNDGKKKVQLCGTIGLSPVVENMSVGYNMLRRLVPVTLAEKWKWGSYKFYHYYGLKNIKRTNKLSTEPIAYPLLQENQYHSIYGNGEDFVLVLK